MDEVFTITVAEKAFPSIYKTSRQIKLKFHSFALQSKEGMPQKNQHLGFSPLMSYNLVLNGFHLQF